MSEEHLSEAARRGLQRAGIHLVRAAIEVVEGISAFLEEMQTADARHPEDRDGDDGPQRIDVE